MTSATIGLCFLILVIPIALINFVNSVKEKKYRARMEERERIEKEEKLRKERLEREYRTLKSDALSVLGYEVWNMLPQADEYVTVNSRAALENYDMVKHLKEHKGKLAQAEIAIEKKAEAAKIVQEFLAHNDFVKHEQYGRLRSEICSVISNAGAYRVSVTYVSSAGNKLGQNTIVIDQACINKFKNDPTLLMNKTEYNKYLKEQQKEALAQEQHDFYERVNGVIDYANENKETLIIKGSQERLDALIASLFDRTVNSIKKVKTIDSEEWELIANYIAEIKGDIEKIVGENRRILEYYQSADFQKVKESCETLMSTQREFNEYITQKAESISQLFGKRVARGETVNEDEYAYIRPYKKTISPFVAEVSAEVFASAENNPLEYVVKYFYPNKSRYPEQIQKLQLLVEELETLKEAKQIIENYKAEYQQYLGDVPDYVMKEDEAGFYERLGFANIDERVLEVEYRFAYTSGGGKVGRSFPFPMTEENIVEVIELLESKLTAKAFAQEQRALMTKKLRDHIKERDNFTCCNCGNSTHVEPNLLLEIDHIIPVAKGGYTEEKNLQTLCWKCNRAKSDKILA